MSAGIIAILQFALFTFLITVAASVAVSVAGYLYGSFIEQTGGVDTMRQKIAIYSRIVSGFQDRLDARKDQAAGSASQLFSAQRQEKQLKMRVRELETAHHKFVRLVGQELQPNKPFEVMAMNTSVSHQVKRGERHPFYDSSWARVVPVHIWAPSMEDAREEFERIFPKTVGFKMVGIAALPNEVGSATGTKAPLDPIQPAGATSASSDGSPTVRRLTRPAATPVAEGAA